VSLQAARPLDPWRWMGAPALICLAATLLLGLPFRLLTLQLPEPIFPMICIFSWAVIRPSILSPIVILLIGLVLDLLWGTPFGLWGLSMLVGYGLTLSMRAMMTGQSRMMMWAWYIGVTGVVLVAGFLFMMLHGGATPNLVGLIWQLLATGLLYPFAHRLIDRFDDADVRFR
jgi:rod shape-determining protein MreD